VEPIRKALLKLERSDDLKPFFNNATAEELRNRVIRPIRWLEERPDQDELRREVEERLVLFGDRMGVAATASKNARLSLIGALLDSLRQPTQRRCVTRAELLEVFQKNTFISVPPDILRRLPITEAGAPLTRIEEIARDVAQIPLPRRTAPRANEVNRLQAQLVFNGVLWFHGSSGLGKSTLALLLARSQGVSWRFADLRSFCVRHSLCPRWDSEQLPPNRSARPYSR